MAPVAPPVVTAPQRPMGEEYRALLQRRLGAFFAWPSAVLVFFLVSHLATSGVVGPRVGLSPVSERAESKPTPFETGTLVAIDVHGRVGATPVESPRRPVA
jgi:hypothetical protein